MVPVISDFLFDEAGDVMKELGQLNSTHDVFIVLIDSAFAFELPSVSAGWIEAFDVETGRVEGDVARRAARRCRRARAPGRTRSRGWPRTTTSTSCASASTNCRPRSRSVNSLRNGG